MKQVKPSDLEAACIAAARQANDPKFKAQIKRLQEGRKKLLKRHKEEYQKMVEDALKE